MIKIISAILSIILLLSCSNLRVAQGEVESRTYIESGDYMNTEFVTTDGEAWIVEDYTAPIGDQVLIIYDRCNKDTIYDDEIVYIIHFTKVR